MLLLAAVAMMAAGCAEKENIPVPEGNGISLALSADGNFPVTDDGKINEVAGYRYEDGVLREILLPETSGNGIFVFHPDSKKGKLYLAANYRSLEAMAEIEPGSPLSQLTEMKAGVGEMMRGGTGMTAMVDLDGMQGRITDVGMLRSVARMDISTFDSGVQVLKVSLAGIADEGYVFPRTSGEDRAIFAGHEHGTLSAGVDDGCVMDFSDEPLENTRRVLAYFPEQENADVHVEVLVSYGGGVSVLRSKMPSGLRRNNVYNISVYGKGAELDLTVGSDDWEYGDGAGSRPALKGLADVENSVLPDGVRVNWSRDTVFVTYRDVEFELALLAEASANVTVDGRVEGVEIAQHPVSKSGLVNIASFSVSGKFRMPGRSAGRVHLDVYDGDVHTGRVVLMFEENPVKLGGRLRFDTDGVCDFGGYVDGEAGTVTLPRGKELSVEFPEGEAGWIKASCQGESLDGERTYVIQCGWRPNDPKADGRVQEGYLVVRDEAGTERYCIKRENWGLPVVKIGETWWTLYNLRGDVRNFEDQINMSNVPDTEEGLFEYLQNVSDDELLELMGEQYQAGNHTGLPLAYDGNAFLYEGMKASGSDFGTTDPSSMAPPGYLIPSYGDYAFFAASDDYNIGGVGERSFVNRQGETLNVRIAERDAVFLGRSYGTVSFYEFTHGENRWVLYGLGHQWSATPGNIAKMHLLLATSGQPGKSWAMEGYASDDRPGQNWIKYTSHNNTKTRMIRCIKAPVEHVY